MMMMIWNVGRGDHHSLDDDEWYNVDIPSRFDHRCDTQQQQQYHREALLDLDVVDVVVDVVEVASWWWWWCL